MVPNVIERVWVQGTTTKVESLRGTAFTEEDGAHTFRIAGVDASGETVPLSGTVLAKILRSDNITIDVSGTITDGVASVTMVGDCYHVPGRFSIVVYLSDGVTTIAIYAAVGDIYRATSDTELDSGTTVPSLVQLEAAYQNALSAAAAANTAATGAELVNVSMSKSGDTITFSATDRTGATTTETMSDQSEAVANLKSAFSANRTLIGTFVSRNLIHYLRPFVFINNKQRNTTGTVVDRTGWMTSQDTIPITPNARYYTNADVFVYYDANDNYVSTQDRTSGSTSIKVTNNADISYAYLNMKSVSDGTTLYAVKEETGHTGTWLIAHAMDYTITPNENLEDSTDDNLLFRNLPMIQFGENAIFSKRLTANMVGEKITQDFLRDRYGSMGITDYSNHDGTVIYHSGKLYNIFSSYTGSGDSANNSACRVVLVKIDEATHNRDAEIVVAKNGDVNGSYTQNGGAGSPNAYLIGTTIHILYTALINSAYMMMHCTYDITTGTLSNYSPVLVDGAILNNAWFNNRYGYVFSAGAYQYSQANSTIATDGNGTYYIGWCFGYGSYGVGIIFSTTDFINWTVFYDYSDWDVAPMYEMPVAYYNGYVYFCIRPDGNNVNKNRNCAFGNYSDMAILGKVAVSDGTLKEAARVYNCGSRPAFFVVGNNVYLFTNPIDRSHGQIISINTSILAESDIIAEFVGGYSYPSFFVDGTTIYTLVSDNFMRLSKFTLPNITESALQTALYSVLNI